MLGYYQQVQGRKWGRRMTRQEIISELEMYTVGRPKEFRPFISVEQLQNLIDEVKKLPVEKRGKWINKSHTSDCGIKFVASECTCCGKKTFFDCDQLVYNYCPNCGSFMENEVESENM